MLEPATTLGSIIGAYIVIYLNQVWLSAAFGLILLYTAYSMLRNNDLIEERERCPSDLTCEYVDCQTGDVSFMTSRTWTKDCWRALGQEVCPACLASAED